MGKGASGHDGQDLCAVIYPLHEALVTIVAEQVPSHHGRIDVGEEKLGKRFAVCRLNVHGIVGKGPPELGLNGLGGNLPVSDITSVQELLPRQWLVVIRFCPGGRALGKALEFLAGHLESGREHGVVNDQDRDRGLADTVKVHHVAVAGSSGTAGIGGADNDLLL